MRNARDLAAVLTDYCCMHVSLLPEPLFRAAHLFSRIASVALLFLVSILPSVAADARNPQVAIVVEDLDGRPVDPLSRPEKAFLFLFVSIDCPICNSYAPEFNRLKADFGPKGIAVSLVYPNADETTAELKRHRTELGLTLEQFRDPRHQLVRAAGAKVTPEAALFVPGPGFVYCGRIDNRYAALGVARPQATKHDLREALQNVIDGRPITAKAERGVGCAITALK